MLICANYGIQFWMFHWQMTKIETFPIKVSAVGNGQRDGIYRVGILEHFLPKSKQTPKPLISKES